MLLHTGVNLLVVKAEWSCMKSISCVFAPPLPLPGALALDFDGG